MTTYKQYTVLCKSNANEVRRNSSFVLVNFPQKVVEFSKDVSLSSKQKIHDLSRKFEIAKFKVAHFRGHQTKIRDNEIEAANFCDMNRNERHRSMNKRM